MQDCSNSSALAVELLESCAKPFTWPNADISGGPIWNQFIKVRNNMLKSLECIFQIFESLISSQKWYHEKNVNSSRIQRVNPPGAETRIFWNNRVSTIATDDLALCINRTSATMILTIQNRQILVFYKEVFQLSFSMLRNDRKCTVIFLCFVQEIQRVKS